MTLILTHNRLMACDSVQLSDGLNVPSYPGYRKIVRLGDGSLFGAGGSRLNADALRDWALAGMDFDKPPKLFRKEGDADGYYWIWMRPDGRVFVGDYDLLYHQTDATDTLGEGNACVYVRGAIDALQHSSNPPLTPRALVQVVMHLAVERCVFVTGPVRVFALDHPERDP